MPRREPPPRPNLILRSRFEPHRLAADHLTEAYAKVVPIRRRPLPAGASKQASVEGERTWQRKEAA